MSKKKLIELIKMDGNERMSVIYEMQPDELRTLFVQALEDECNDTRNGCAKSIDELDGFIHDACVKRFDSAKSCSNYHDKDLEGL